MELKLTIAATLLIGVLPIAGGTVAAAPPAVVDVWLDVDTATGSGDVDDGLMLIQAFHSPEIRIRGISVVFGNAPLAQAVPIARTIVSKFGPPALDPRPGAASADQLGQSTAAVEGLAAELRRAPLTVVAVGPVTNIGTLVRLYPELHGRIEQIIMVAARRPGQRFVTHETQQIPYQDFNFELDPAAMQAILDTDIPLVFAPWEVSSQVWISRADLDQLRRRDGSGRWIAETSQYWIERWERGGETRGFNPFDTLAIGWLTHPEWIATTPMQIAIETGPDDRAEADTKPPPSKPYLIARPWNGEGRKAIYCYRPDPEFHRLLIKRLAGRDAPR